MMQPRSRCPALSGPIPAQDRTRITARFENATPTHEAPSRTAGRRALIWPTNNVAGVPAIMGIHGTTASAPWISMQTIVSQERAHMPRGAHFGLLFWGLGRDGSDSIGAGHAIGDARGRCGDSRRCAGAGGVLGAACRHVVPGSGCGCEMPGTAIRSRGSNGQG